MFNKRDKNFPRPGSDLKGKAASLPPQAANKVQDPFKKPTDINAVAVKGILNITSCFGNSCAQDHKALQREIRAGHFHQEMQDQSYRDHEGLIQPQ